MAHQAYSNLVPASADLNLLYANKPKFFDSVNNVYWDGQQAFVYVDEPDQQPQLGVLPHLSDSVATALESDHVVVGNGTAGNLEEHANALQSYYLLDIGC